MAVINGTTGNDHLYGGSENDEIYGYGGRDYIEAGGGDDLIDGGVGAGVPFDGGSFHGGSGNDTILSYGDGAGLYGGDDNDVLTAFGEASVLDGGAGNDTLIGADNVEAWRLAVAGVIDYFSESFLLQSGADVLTTGAGFDRISLSPGFDDFEVTDLAFGDVFYFNSFNLPSSAFSYNATTGELEVDTNENSIPDRFIDVGTGFATHVLATEILEYDGYSALAFVYFLSSIAVNATGGAGRDLLAGGAVNDDLSGSGGDDVLKGYLGADTLTGDAGIDTILGGAGDDVIYGYLDAADVARTGAAFNEKELLYGGAGDDYISAAGSEFSANRNDINFIVYGGLGNDIIIGSDGRDYIYDVSGSDSIVGGGGSDEYIVGYVQYIHDGENDLPADRIYILEDSNLSENGVHTDTLSGIEKVWIYGGEGDDILVSVSYDIEGLESNLSGGRVELKGNGGDNFLQNINGVATLASGVDSADTLLGGASLEYISLAADGGDFVASGEGYDVLRFHVVPNTSGAPVPGTVLVDFDESDGLYVQRSGLTAANVTIVEAGGRTTLILDVDLDAVSDLEIILLGVYDGVFSYSDGGSLGMRVEFTGDIDRRGFAGGYFADSLVGGANDDSLYGFYDDDTLQGGSGADLLEGAEGFDIASYDGSGSAVTVNLLTSATSGGDAAGDVLHSIEGLIGSAFGDSLTGNGSDNLLKGGAGADSLDGGGGNDTASYESSGAGVTLYLLNASASGGDAAGDVLTSIENLVGSGHSDSLAGDDGDNEIGGNAGNDTIRGEGGADTLNGGSGFDLIFGNDGDDYINGGSENDDLRGSAGNDTVLGGYGRDVIRGNSGDDDIRGGAGGDTLAGGLDNDELRGASGDDAMKGEAGDDYLSAGIDDDLVKGNEGADTLIGGEGNDSLQGNPGDDLLYGQAGNDDLRGGNDNDTLDGGSGNDTLRGNSGDDVFVYAPGADDDLIIGFEGGAGIGDVIDLSVYDGTFDDFADVQAAASEVGASTVIDLGGGDSITLHNVALADLDGDDFLF